MDVSHDWSQFSAQGRHKANPVNEDRSGALTAPLASVTLAYVADGISTAELGSGDKAAQAVANAVAACRNKFVEMANDISRSATDDASWAVSSASLLEKVAFEAGKAIATELDYLASLDGAAHAVEHTMGSTLTAAVAVGDQAVIHALGDSPALLYQGSLKRLIKLTMDHNVSSDPDAATDGTQALAGSEGQALTRLIGAVLDTEDRYAARNDEPLRLKIQLSPGDVFVLASDGLVNSVDPYDEVCALRRLEEVIQEGLASGANARVLAQRLVDLADNEKSNDNITANVLVISGKNQGGRSHG